MPIDYRRY
ncbi:a2a85b23-e1fc-42b6-81b8-1742e318a5b5 [Thermothielavioides terrestris]|uniref:A2a85b23-e1fc-42b6-81b8-1742e318a5b5 n=1 Tax=Thermothielavioides terrestris TaxID=2587410 RepID=A0A3S4D431_9PEZI|nr:a2a85b23-e1fc-42b6-81b8-1742e318a5b5 [Thermothielavioides terrestris]